MENFDKPPQQIFNMMFTPLSFMPDIRFRETKIFQKNGFNKNNYLGHAEYFLHFV